MPVQSAQITSNSDVVWSNGALFNGYVLVSAVLPGTRTQATLKDTSPVLRVPVQTRVAIREGKYDSDVRVWFTNSLVPPGVTYNAKFYDSDDQLVATLGGTFTVTADPYVLTHT